MPRNRQSAWPLLAVLVLLILGACAYTLWQQQQHPIGDTLQLTADLVSDDRLIFGGAPRPAPASGEEVRFSTFKNQGYIVGYSDSRRDPLWVSYRSFHTEHPFALPRPSGFHTDPRTAAKVKDSDFTGSGYDRGHMAPNEDIMRDYGKDAQVETFLLSNICPQAPDLNRDVWAKLEVDERKYADSDEEVWIIDGPIFSDLAGTPTPRLASGIAIPAAFYKIIIDEEGHPGGKPRAFSFIMPQTVKSTDLPQQYLSTISEIEKATHLQFLWKLDAVTQKELKETKSKMW